MERRDTCIVEFNKIQICRLKIVHLIYDDWKNPWCGGGGAKRVLEIYRRLGKKHEIMVITGNYPDAKNETIDSISFRRVGSSCNYWISRISYSLGVPFVLPSLSFDLLVNDFSLFSPCFANLYTRKPVITLVHHIAGSHAVRKYFIIGIFSYLAEKLNIRLSKNIITVSQSIAKKVKAYNPKTKLVCIYNGIDTKYFMVRKSENNYVLFLGRIDIYMKGLDVLLDAYRLVVDEFGESYTLVIAGRGKEKDIVRLKKRTEQLLIEKNVDVIGEVTEAKKMELLSGCMFLVMPSRFEGWGIGAVEAAATGTPTVGTKIDGLMDAVINGETGILVEPENPDIFAEAVTRMIKDRELRESMGSNAREWAKRFDWDIIAGQQESFYTEILNSHESIT